MATTLVGIMTHGQNREVDSLYKALAADKQDSNKAYVLINLSSFYYRTGNYSKSDSFTSIALKFSQQINFKRGQCLSYLNMGSVCRDQGNYADAIKDESKALEFAEELHDSLTMASTYSNIGSIYDRMGNYTEALKNNLLALKTDQLAGNKRMTISDFLSIGNLYQEQGNYPEALKQLLMSLKVAEELKDKQGIGNAYGNIGIIYQAQGNKEEALSNYQKSLKIEIEIGNKYAVGYDYANIGSIYLMMHNYDSALVNQFHALKSEQEIGDKDGMSNTYSNLGNIYYEQGNYVDALKYQALSLRIEEETGNKDGAGYAFVGLAYIATRQKDYAKAKAYADSALNMSKQTGDRAIAVQVFKSFSQMDSATNNFKAAYGDYKRYINYRDSLKNEENTKKIVSEQMQYEFDKKQAEEKAEQDKKDAIHNEQTKKQRIVIYSVSLGLLLVLLLAITIFRSLQQNKKKTKIILEQKVEVEKKNVVIEEQKAIVEQKNRDILDSIVYAKRLQDAILPPLSIIEKYLPDSFVLYKPKDIVAGDFYWMEKAGDNILIAACDCTGHGVPGALVSVVCSNALNRTVKEFGITEPGKILDKVRELVLETFEKSESEVKDGMDISLCCINQKTGELQWSGAYNPLWYIQNGEMKEVIADKQPIGKTDVAKAFNTNKLKLNKGDILYLFTDGYADQFGGPKGKKFKYKQFQELLVQNSKMKMQEQKQFIETAFEEWQGNLEQVDDVLVIGIRV